MSGFQPHTHVCPKCDKTFPCERQHQYTGKKKCKECKRTAREKVYGQPIPKMRVGPVIVQQTETEKAQELLRRVSG